MELRPLIKQLVKRIDQLEQTVAQMKAENRCLRELTPPKIREPYEVRGEGETPDYGFGEWSPDFFVQNLKKTDDFYMKNVGHSVLKRTTKEFIAAVLYAANGNCHVVRVRPKTRKNRNGNPIYLDLNFKKRRRQVTLEAAVKRIFEKPFLPSKEEIEEQLGAVPEHVRDGLEYYQNYLHKCPSKKARNFRSWEAKVELLLAIANYKIPEREKKLSKAERADENYKREWTSEVGRWWIQPHAWSMEKIVDHYDHLLSLSEAYKTDLRAYFEERPDRRQQYREAGGTLA